MNIFDGDAISARHGTASKNTARQVKYGTAEYSKSTHIL